MKHTEDARALFHAHFSRSVGSETRGLYLMMLSMVLVIGLAAVGDGVFDTCYYARNDVDDDIAYTNPEFKTLGHCMKKRRWFLAGMSPLECAMCRRIMMACLLGTMIGFERRRPDRPAGIRTMAVVSLGSCIFTIDSMFAFSSSPDTWDASRVAAAIPSGVGFLGAGIIYKHPPKDERDVHSVHGLTTASSVWLSAAVGIGAGGGLFLVSFFATMAMILILRFGPHMPGDHPPSILDSHYSVDIEAGDRESSLLAESQGAGCCSPSGSSSSESAHLRNPRTRSDYSAIDRNEIDRRQESRERRGESRGSRTPTARHTDARHMASLRT